MSTAQQPTSAAAKPCPDPADARWADIEIVHDTAYQYAQTVSQSHHVAHLTPLTDAKQQVLLHRLSVSPQPAFQHLRRDTHGNTSLHYALTTPHRDMQVNLHSRVRCTERFTALRPDASEPWERVRDRMHYVSRAAFDPAVAYVQPSPHVPRLEALGAYARASFTPGCPLARAAIHLMQRIHADFEYRSSSTQVDTPLAQAFEQRSGVCQDFAQVMIGACRALGLSARYVSGYLLTVPADGGPALQGADASHAWVQVYAPGTPGLGEDGWLDLDPTNAMVPSLEHVRLAVGRDFADVSPLRGVVRGGGQHSLRVSVTTRRTTPGIDSVAA